MKSVSVLKRKGRGARGRYSVGATNGQYPGGDDDDADDDNDDDDDDGCGAREGKAFTGAAGRCRAMPPLRLSSSGTRTVNSSADAGRSYERAGGAGGEHGARQQWWSAPLRRELPAGAARSSGH